MYIEFQIEGRVLMKELIEATPFYHKKESIRVRIREHVSKSMKKSCYPHMDRLTPSALGNQLAFRMK